MVSPDPEERAVLHQLLLGIVTGLVFVAYLAIAVVRARREKSEPRQGRQRRKRGKRELIWIHSEADRGLHQPTAPERLPFRKQLDAMDAIRATCSATASFASPRERRTAWSTWPS